MEKRRDIQAKDDTELLKAYRSSNIVLSDKVKLLKSQLGESKAKNDSLINEATKLNEMVGYWKTKAEKKSSWGIL